MAEPIDSDSDRVGPYDTEQQARDDCRVVHQAIAGHPKPRHTMAPLSEQRLFDECRRASVQLGAYDQRIVHWLAAFEPEHIQVVLGLVARAYDSGRERGRREAW